MKVHEVEVKASLLETPDMDEARRFSEVIENKLEKAGARFEARLIQEDIYLTHPSRNLASTDESFRLRSEEREGELSLRLTYKGPKVSEHSKARFEKEVEVSADGRNGLMEILHRLGFGELMTVRKQRGMYDLGGIEVDLDIVEGLGVFCEMEILSDDVGEAESRILKVMGSMGWSRFERRSYLELLLSKQF